MPSDEYTSVARGPLKLKGAAGVTKKKKKKDKDKSGARTDLERNLSTGDGDGALARKPSEPPDRRPSAEPSDAQEVQGVEAELEDPDSTKTEAERRFAEAKRKRVRTTPPRPTAYYSLHIELPRKKKSPFC
jgi:protein FAM32A